MKGHHIINNQSVFLFILLNAVRLWIPSYSLSSLVEKTRSTPHELSARLLKALRGRTPANGKVLNLETDFYDKTTGLYSEGVWHNALVGIASLENNNNDHDCDRIAESLFQYSWDIRSFRRRSWSGEWDHSTLDSDSESDVGPPAQANYYCESSEHRCIQHGIAIVFWSKILLANTPNQDGVFDGNRSSSGSDSDDDDGLSRNKYETYREQEQLMMDCFLGEFHDPLVKKWTTVGQSQGGGGVLRPSASAAAQTFGISEDDENEENTPYYRAVDQAIAVLACLEHVRVLESHAEQAFTVAAQRTMMVDLVQSTCLDILSPNGFGYEDVGEARSYLGLDRNRNFWHDGWTFLALLKAREYVWPLDTTHGEIQLISMWQDLVDMYGSSDGMIWHWPKELKDDSSNVQYCGDNALAHAIRRNLDATDSNEDGFWNFVEDLTEGNDGGLSSVADVYPQVRLHPNTELSALLVWP